MKNLLPVLAFVLMAVTNTQGQTFALASTPKGAELSSYTPANFRGNHERRKMGTLALTGGLIAAGGFVTSVVGLVLYLGEAINTVNNQYGTAPADPYATGRTVLQVGGCLAIVGGTLGVIGFIRDHNERSGRWGLVAPKPNQMGLAYNF